MNEKQLQAMKDYFVPSASFDVDSEGTAIFHDTPNAAGFHRTWRIERNGDVFLEVSDEDGWHEEDLVYPAAA